VNGVVNKWYFWKQRRTYTPVVCVGIDVHQPLPLHCQQTTWNLRRSCGHPAACLQVCCHWVWAVPIGCWLQVLSGSAWQWEGFGRWNRGFHIGGCKLVGRYEGQRSTKARLRAFLPIEDIAQPAKTPATPVAELTSVGSSLPFGMWEPNLGIRAEHHARIYGYTGSCDTGPAPVPSGLEGKV